MEILSFVPGVTMIQRGSTYVMSGKKGMERLLGSECEKKRCLFAELKLLSVGGVYWEGGPPTEYADRISASITTHYKKLMLKRVTKEIADIDRYALFKGTNPSIRPIFFEHMF